MKENQHDQDDKAATTGLRLAFTVVLNAFITAVEIIGGIASGSISLLSDALHNFTDSVSLWISYMAMKVSRKENTASMTYGYKRAQIMAALLNSSILVGVVLFLFVEAYRRFLNPTTVNGSLMLVVATIGLAANLLSVFLLKRDAKHNLNIRSSYLHLMADTLSSVAVFAGGIVIYIYKSYWLDPLLSVLIGIYLLKETWGITAEAVHILMEGAPHHLSIEEIRDEVEGIPSVESLHHVHIWQIDDENINFEGHVDVCEDISIGNVDAIRRLVEEALKKHGINHITLQMELLDACTDKNLIKGRKQARAGDGERS